MKKSFFILLLAALSSLVSAADIMRPDSTTVTVNIVGLTDADSIHGLTMDIADLAFHQSGSLVIPRVENGLFQRKFLVPNAQLTDINIPLLDYVSIYVEPGADLTVEIDANKLRRRNGPGRDLTKFATFGGSLGELNAQLSRSPKLFDSFMQWNIPESTSPKQVRDSLIGIYDRNMLKINEYAATLPADSKAAAILRANELARIFNDITDYADFNESHNLLPQEYYREFMEAVLKSDSLILTAINSNNMLNRLGFSGFLPSNRMSVDLNLLRKNIKFITDRWGTFSPDEMEKIFSGLDTTATAPQVQDIHLFKSAMVMNHFLFTAAERAGIRDDFAAQFDKSPDFANRAELGKHSDETLNGDPLFLREYLNLEGEDMPLVWQYAVSARDWENIIGADSLNLDMYGITDITLRKRLSEAYDEARTGSGSNELPDNFIGKYLKQQIEPFKGKYLLLDIWDLYCPPCRETIQSS